LSELQYPSRVGSEKELLTEYLDWYREAILRKMEGASEETLRKKIVPSQTTLLGIVKHLAWVEVWWFQMVFDGRDVEDPEKDDPDFDWRIEPHDTTAAILQLYRGACNESRAIVDATDDLGSLSARGDPKYSLRRTLIHMIEETARHAGHADIIREVVDGQTGP
jgi:uncharacterized damage-inducible protein DinB